MQEFKGELAQSRVAGHNREHDHCRAWGQLINQPREVSPLPVQPAIQGLSKGEQRGFVQALVVPLGLLSNGGDGLEREESFQG
ncbi:MAG: hypothetical protein ACKOJF_04865, partial [Planctomycetaceae bacterium]